MNTTPGLRRELAAGSLVATAVLSSISLLTMPDWPDGFAALLETIDESPTTSLVSAMTFVLAQLPFLVAVLAIGALVIPRKPVLGSIGVALAVVGGFGHSVYGGVIMTQLEMAKDSAQRDVHADLLTALESSPLVVFMAMGLLGTVLGLLLLAIGLWRSHSVPAWIPGALVLFLLTEFVGTALTDWAAYASSLLYVTAFTGLALAVWQRPLALPQPASELLDAEPSR